MESKNEKAKEVKAVTRRRSLLRILCFANDFIKSIRNRKASFPFPLNLTNRLKTIRLS